MLKFSFVSAKPAVVGATITVSEKGGKPQPARVIQANPNGDIIVELTESEESPKRRVWAATVAPEPDSGAKK